MEASEGRDETGEGEEMKDLTHFSLFSGIGGTIISIVGVTHG